MTTITAVPLLLSSSGISGSTRFRIIVLCMAALFLFQVISTYLGIYSTLYEIYRSRPTDETTRIFEVLSYREADAYIIAWLTHVFQMFVRHIVVLGTWAGLVYWSRRQHDGSFLERFL